MESARSWAMGSGFAARDDRHDRIWVRLGVCRPCRKTFTALPDWLAPSAPFTLKCRQQACEHIGAGNTAEQSTPHCKDPTRLPDASTVPSIGTAPAHDPLVLDQGRSATPALCTVAHHPCLGSRRALPYSAHRGKKSMRHQALNGLKQQISLLDYLQSQDWRPGPNTQPWSIDGTVSAAR